MLINQIATPFVVLFAVPLTSHRSTCSAAIAHGSGAQNGWWKTLTFQSFPGVFLREEMQTYVIEP